MRLLKGYYSKLTGNMQVITSHSGYGRVGALLSQRFHNIYQVDHGKAETSHRQCGKYDYDRLEYLASHAAGIR